MQIREEDRRIFATSIPFFKPELYSMYTPSVGMTDQSLLAIMQYEAYGQSLSDLNQTSDSVLQAVEIIWNSTALKVRVV